MQAPPLHVYLEPGARPVPLPVYCMGSIHWEIWPQSSVATPSLCADHVVLSKRLQKGRLSIASLNLTPK